MTKTDIIRLDPPPAGRLLAGPFPSGPRSPSSRIGVGAGAACRARGGDAKSARIWPTRVPSLRSECFADQVSRGIDGGTPAPQLLL